MKIRILIPVYRPLPTDGERRAIANNVRQLAAYDVAFVAPEGLEDVLVGGVGLGQDGGVEHVHVGGGDVLHRDDSQQVVLGADHRQGVDVPVPHDLPGAAQADGPVHPLHLAVIDVADLGVDVGAHPGRLHPELFQDELGLLVHLAGPAGLTDQVAGLIFQLRIGDGGADGIGIRVAVADHHHFVGFFGHLASTSVGFCRRARPLHGRFPARRGRPFLLYYCSISAPGGK